LSLLRAGDWGLGRSGGRECAHGKRLKDLAFSSGLDGCSCRGALENKGFLTSTMEWARCAGIGESLLWTGRVPACRACPLCGAIFLFSTYIRTIQQVLRALDDLQGLSTLGSLLFPALHQLSYSQNVPLNDNILSYWRSLYDVPELIHSTQESSRSLDSQLRLFNSFRTLLTYPTVINLLFLCLEVGTWHWVALYKNTSTPTF
jgi:hypothetical protein